MGTSYSAIKIPVPGNLIDTPGATPGSLLYYNDGVYSNFEPLIVNLRSDTGAKNLTFNVSVSTGDRSYSNLTETGMYLYQHDTGDMRLSINNSTATVNATLHVQGNARITEGLHLGPGGTEMKFDGNGYAYPTSTVQHKFMSYNMTGEVQLKTLENSTFNSYDNYLSFSDNTLVLDLEEAKGDGINIAVDAASGENTISADVVWLRDPENNLHRTTVGSGILISDTGVFTIEASDLNNDGDLFSGVDGIIPIVDGVIKIDKAWTRIEGNLFALDDEGISMIGGILSVDFQTAGSGIAIASGMVDSLWTKNEYAVTGKNVSDVDETRYVRHTKFAATGTAHGVVDFVYVVGSSRVNYLGDVENESFWGKTVDARSFSAIFKPLDYDIDGHGGTAWIANDGGGIKIQTTDNNNDEFAILCESINNAVTGAWGGESGHPIIVGLEDREMFVEGGDGGYPTFYVKASSGMMYNSSNYYTEGRICIGAKEYLESGKLHRADNIREGLGTLPNPPAHVSIISTCPSIMMHQVLNPDTGIDNTAPTIIMSSNNESNKDAWGCISGSDAAATVLSNRDSSIFNIETTTKHMPYSFLDVDQGIDGLPTPSGNGTQDAENRLRLDSRLSVWSLEYYPTESSTYITGPNAVDEVGDDTQFDPTYCYMKMGAGDETGSSPGTFYLPIGTPITGGSPIADLDYGAQPPVGMQIGGFWIDPSEYRIHDGPGVWTETIRINNIVRCKLGNEDVVPD